MSIGGIEQWITIKGASCANPVILFLHGGPGNTLSPYADSIYGAWEKDFTLVQWDQRGAGRTYGRNPPPIESTLTIEGMAEDGMSSPHTSRNILARGRSFCWPGRGAQFLASIWPSPDLIFFMPMSASHRSLAIARIRRPAMRGRFALAAQQLIRELSRH